MYPNEVLWKNKRAATNFQNGVVKWFKEKYGIDVQAGEPQNEELGDAKLTFTYCIPRLTVGKNSVAYPIGSLDGVLRETLMALLQTSATPPKDAKTVETELTRVLGEVLDVEFKANQVIYDPKSLIYVSEKALLTWNSLDVTQYVSFPFTTPTGELTIVLPILDAETQNYLVGELTGYSPRSRILIVDDSPTSRKLSRHCLSLGGLTVADECEDGKAALAKIIGSKPGFDLVIADWHMPNMTGLDLLKAVRKDKDHKNLKIIFATGERNVEEVTNAIREGVNGYVVKPFEPEAVFKAMKKASGLKTEVKKAG